MAWLVVIQSPEAHLDASNGKVGQKRAIRNVCEPRDRRLFGSARKTWRRQGGLPACAAKLLRRVLGGLKVAGGVIASHNRAGVRS